jgi:hypothetical protein
MKRLETRVTRVERDQSLLKDEVEDDDRGKVELHSGRYALWVVLHAFES